MKAWIARDENGALFLYGCKPYKYQADEESKVIFDSEDGHFMRVENENAYPEVTFENSPQMVEISSKDDDAIIEKAAQWLYDHLTTEYQGAVLKIVAKEKGLMPVEFVEKFKKAMEE